MKKKGFTLIELLAVIVILAIIALIATPLVLKYIEKSRKESKVDSAYSYVRNLETEIANYSIKNNGTKYTTDKENIKELGLDIKVKGENPEDGKVCISSLGQVEKGIFKYDNYYVSYDGKKGSISDKTAYDNFSCNISDVVTTEAAGLYDSNNNLLYSWDQLINNYGINLQLDYMDEDYNFLVDESLVPGVILSSPELSSGVKLVIDDSVTRIGIAAFYGCTSLKEVIISDSVTSIGMSAFEECTELTKVTIGTGVTTIGDFAFSDCINLTEAIIPEGVITIGDDAFSDCTNLKKVVIPTSVTSIGSGAFFRCENLIEAIIPDGIKRIESYTFTQCKSLKQVTIPNSVNFIGKEAFNGCENLKTINYSGTQQQWNSIQLVASWNTSMPSDYIINYGYMIQN